MKTTIDIPDDLYRQVKAKTALEGKRIRDVTIELYRRWLGHGPEPAPPEGAAAEWLEEWLRLADAAMQHALPGPSARELLAEDRDRLARPG